MALPIVVTGDEQSLELVAPSRKKRPRKRFETRTPVPKDVAPNLRDYGKTCDAHLGRIIQSLQRATGTAHVSERVLCELYEQDTGHAPGVGTLRAALDRLAERGECHQVWLVKGGILPGSGDVATAGLRLIRWAMNRHDRQRFIGAFRRHEEAFRKGRAKTRREMTTGRVNHEAVWKLLMVPERAAPKPKPAEMAADEKARRVREQLEELEAWAAELDELSYPPPG